MGLSFLEEIGIMRGIPHKDGSAAHGTSLRGGAWGKEGETYVPDTMDLAQHGSKIPGRCHRGAADFGGDERDAFDQSGADGPAHRPGDYRGEYRAAPPAAHHHAGGQGPAGRLAVSDDRVLGKGFPERGVQPAPAAFRGAAVPGNALFRPQPHRRPDDPPLRRPGLVPAFRLLPRLYGGGLLGDVPVHPAFLFHCAGSSPWPCWR